MFAGLSLLVIGGTGFIGKHLVAKAVQEGFVVSVISLNKPNSKDLVKNVKYHQVNICNAQELKKKLPTNKFEYVVNLGGYVDHSNYFNGGKDVINVHFNGAFNLINFLDKSIIKNFIQIGSSDEYGNCPSPQKESMREQPNSPYSLSKLLTNNLLQMLGRTEKFPSIILRLFLVYGPDQAKNRFIPQIIEGCAKNIKFDTSEGDQLRDFCHIDDIVIGILNALKAKNMYGEIINLASGKPVKIKDVIKLIQELSTTGKPQFGKVPYRDNENMVLYGDITKAGEILSWRPKINLKEGIKGLINQES
tara:strand:+ start:383 stop:1297 length:915 start_codon:yes stop_codon:yes gene_type:complete